MIKDAKGKPSWSLTLMVASGVVGILVFAVGASGLVTATPSSEIALFLTPFFALRGFRAHSKDKAVADA